jgi:hypothetical protein
MLEQIAFCSLTTACLGEYEATKMEAEGRRESVQYCLDQAKTCEYKGLRAKDRKLCETFLNLALQWRKLANQIENSEQELPPPSN